MAESEPLLSKQEIVKNLRKAALKRKVNAYVDDLADKRTITDKKMDTIAITLAGLSFVSIFLSVLILEVSWHSDAYEHTSIGLEFCKLIVSMLTFVSIIALWRKYQFLARNVVPNQVRSKKKKHVQEEGKNETNIENNIDLDDIIWCKYQSPLTFLVEVFFICLHCPPLTHPKYAPLTLFRAYHFLSLMRFIPFVKRVRMMQIESGHKASQSNWSIINIWLRFYPWLSVIGFCAVFLPILSYSVFAVERADDESDIDSYGTAFWLTTWTVFVGQAYDPSYAGRLPALLCGISSVVVAALVFVALQRTLEIDAQDEAITTDTLERQMQKQVKKAIARYTFEVWRSYKKSENFTRTPAQLKLRKELKKEWRTAKRKLKREQQRRPAGLASVMMQIQELAQCTVTSIDDFRVLMFGNLSKMEKKCKDIDKAYYFIDQKNTQQVDRLLQTYTNLQQNSNDQMKKITEKMNSFRQKNQSTIQKVQSKSSNSQKETLNNLRKEALRMGEQFKEVINKQASETEDLNHAKMAVKASKELQKQQMDICDDLTKEIKQLAKMQRELLASSLQTYSEKVIDTINSDLKSQNSSPSIFKGRRSSYKPPDRRRTSTPASRNMTMTTTTISGSM